MKVGQAYVGKDGQWYYYTEKDVKEKTMAYKYQTNVKYKGIEEVEVHYWNFKDVALDYLNDSGRYGDVEWKDVKGVWE